MDELLVGHRHAKTPIDVACWDVFGRSVGLPVCDLLGGRIPGSLPLISSVHQGDPGDMRVRVAEHRDEGYRGTRSRSGRPKPRAARPSTRNESRQAWRTRNRETVALRRQTDVAIILDELADSETAIINMVADNAGDCVGLKVSKNGGLTACRRQRDIAIAAGFTMSVQDTVGSDIAFAAVLHLGQTVPRKLLRCVLDVRGMVSATTATIDGLTPGRPMSAPDTPGLGVNPNLSVLGEPVLSFS